MGAKIKVLQVVPCLELGGTEAFIMNNYRNIDRNKIQFDFFVFSKQDYPYLREIKDMGGKVHFGIQPSIRNVIGFYKAFKQAVSSGGPYAAIHCHANAGNALPLICGALCGIKNRISHSHATNQMPLSFIKRLFYLIRIFFIKRFATQFFACSCDAGEELYGKNFFDAKGAVIHNGIDVQKYSKEYSDTERNLMEEFCICDSNDLIVGNITRFDSNKNQIFAVDVFFEILKRYPDAILLLGGVDGGCLNNVKAKVADLGIENNVRFIGKRQDVTDCLKLIDIYLFPSLFEGLGIALLEAQAAGCLCFASSGVSNESDMGLGTVEYYDLQDGAAKWVERMLNKFDNFTPPGEAEILTAFKNNGYDITESANKLVKFYEGR